MIEKPELTDQELWEKVPLSASNRKTGNMLKKHLREKNPEYILFNNLLALKIIKQATNCWIYLPTSSNTHSFGQNL